LKILKKFVSPCTIICSVVAEMSHFRSYICEHGQFKKTSTFAVCERSTLFGKAHVKSLIICNVSTELIFMHGPCRKLHHLQCMVLIYWPVPSYHHLQYRQMLQCLYTKKWAPYAHWKWWGFRHGLCSKIHIAPGVRNLSLENCKCYYMAKRTFLKFKL
jgi:hypothetical protein